MLRVFIMCLLIFCSMPLRSQQWRNADESDRVNRSMFRSIDSWQAPNDYRTPSGAPGHRYWQQRADYVINTSLDTLTHTVSGSERITYHNNSPDALGFLWLQLDQNVNSIEHSRTYAAQPALPETVSPRARAFLSERYEQFDGGYTLSRVDLVDANGRRTTAKSFINGTVMKVTLPEPLQSGGVARLEIDWSYRVPFSGRGAKEKLDAGWLYEIAQWFPRMSVYDDVNGWQVDQYLGQGEFYLNFGNYEVNITVPFDHIVAATGTLQNPQEVLTPIQQRRLKDALSSDSVRYIIFPDEVMRPDTRPVAAGTLTWKFKAENVRDFAWASSKTFVWDAAGFRYAPSDKPILCQSFYPKVAMPLWNKVSTKAVIQTMKTYGRIAFPYPYPQATNVHGPVFGMEYPMICFCGARPNPDGTYSQRLEYALVGVTIHEVGHNWFPMIVASDERQFTWLDEGVNSFVEFYAEGEWDSAFPSRRGTAKSVVGYMRDTNQVPIMIHSDLIHKDFGNNGYTKPAAGLVMLREHISNTALFDDAFQAYCKTWAFKHPQPFDFFRMMDKGLGEDLAWFWRGWFYTTYANDQSIDTVTVSPADSVVGNSRKGKTYWRISVSNKGRLLMPLHMNVHFSDGTIEQFKLPIEIWKKNELKFVKGIFSDKEVVKVVIDPDDVFADIDQKNNVWEKGTAMRP
jgi:hypothetical protein